jgi:hypothetical protein
VPELPGDALAVAFQAGARGVAADVLDIAGEQGKRIGIEARVDGLGEIDAPSFLAADSALEP